MNAACNSFRGLLEQQLLGTAPRDSATGSGGPGGLTELSWHAHLLSCGECRRLLEAEEALEMVLASLPEPRLPEALARRVIERLRSSRDLEHLLEMDALPAADGPDDGLAASILSGLKAERARQRSGVQGVQRAHGGRTLDQLLDMDRELAAPVALTRRILAGLEPVRDASPAVHPVPPHSVSPWTARLARISRSTWMTSLLAASIAFVAFFGWMQNRSRTEHGTPGGQGAPGPRDGGVDSVASSDLPPDDEFLAALDVLEGWDLVEELGETAELVAAFEAADELLLEFADEPGADPSAPPDGGPDRQDSDLPGRPGREEREEG